jgi:hexosaminidase
MEGRQALVADRPDILIEEKKIENKSLFSEKTSLTISSQTEGAEIFYTLDGSEPSTQSLSYSDAIEIDRSTVIKAIARKKNYVNSPVTRAELIQSTTYRDVVFKHPFSPKYAAMGKLSVADGIFGSIGDYQRNWLGFEGVDMVATIDLGEMKSIGEIKVNFLEDIKSWIFLPEYVTIELSKNGEIYKRVDRIDLEAPLAERKSKSQLCTSSFSREEAQFIRISAKSMGLCPEWHPGAGARAWLFVDEIMVE